MNIHVLQHVVFETPGTIVQWAANRGYPLSYTHLYEAQPTYQPLDTIDMLVIMGGPMGVYEAAQWYWMPQEKQYIADAIAAGKIVLGICLGAQLLAEALGANVYPHHTQEIGFFPLQPTDHPLMQHLPKPWTVLHWHGDTFDLPPGATLLASSEACAHQAFVKGRCLGLQFHPEADADLVGQMVRHEGDGLVAGPFVQTVGEILRQAPTALAESVPFMTLLDTFIQLSLRPD
jgi:GMP synthase-like glutamine amidotransferase